MAEPQEQLNDGGDSSIWGKLGSFVDTVADKGIEFIKATRVEPAPQPQPDQTPVRPVNQTPADRVQTTSMQGQQGNQQVLLLGLGLLGAALLIPRLRARG